MLTACQREGVKLLVAHQRRHLSPWLAAQKAVREGAIGDPIQITVDSGGGLLNVLSHSINLAQFLVNDVPCEWVMGGVERQTDRYERSHPCEDAAIGIGQFRGGVQLVMVSNVGSAHPTSNGARVVGTEGILVLGTTRADHPVRGDGNMRSPEGSSAKYNDEHGSARILSTRTGAWEKIDTPWHDPFVHLAQEAVDWVEGRVDDAISSGQKGRATIEIMMALYESARKRRRIDLPLKTLANPLGLMVANGDLPIEYPGRYEQRARIVRGEAMTWG
jgi:UDP-N-acetyl-2-amino-2-deoxyglucuronate dehydrogenase